MIVPNFRVSRKRLPFANLTPSRASDKAVAFCNARYAAGLNPAKPAGSVAGDEIIDGVADGGGDYAEEGGYRERETEEGEHAEDGVGTEADGLTFNEDY